MFSKLKSFLSPGEGKTESEEPKLKFRIDLLSKDQRKELDEQMRINRQAKIDQSRDRKLFQALEWAKSVDLDEIEDPDEREMVAQIKEDEKKRIQEGAKVHSYLHSRTFTTDVTPTVLQKKDKLRVFGKRVFGIIMPEEKDQKSEKDGK